MEILSTLAILTALRFAMVDVDLVGEPIHAYIVPSEDQHFSEYVAECDERRKYISGFTGSAGFAVITNSSANLWTDGRYFDQADDQLDKDLWTVMKSGQPGVLTMSEWLLENLENSSRIGLDPKLYSKSDWDSLENALAQGPKHMSLIPINENLVDHIWLDKPPCSSQPIVEHPLEFAGVQVTEKLNQTRQVMESNRVQFLVISELDQVAWFLNLRGKDILFSPFFFSFIIVTMEGFELFVNATQLSQEQDLFEKIQSLGGEIFPYESVYTQLESHGNDPNVTIWLSNSANQELASKVPSDKRLIRPSPIAMLKATKNPIEVQGLVNCHIRDGAAVIQFFAWLEEALDKNEEISEIAASQVLKEYREKLENNRGLSFESIMASGPNGAIIHYAPTPGPIGPNNRLLDKNEILLLDSGGQYLDGTTDVTRTVKFGIPSDFEKEAYSRVLKGMIQLRKSFFPLRTRSDFLDRIARQSLWEIGLDYNHGTGHGIGSFLSVHEGPYGINSDANGLLENMFMSDEPGYYEVGKFGVRHENIIRTVVADTPYNFGNKTYLTFEDVTLVPFQIKMIKVELLTHFEVEYLNDYHTKVREIVGKYIQEHLEDQRAYNYLMRETEPMDLYGNDCIRGKSSMILIIFTFSLSYLYSVTI